MESLQLTADYGYTSARGEKSVLSAARFVSINAVLELIQPDASLGNSDNE